MGTKTVLSLEEFLRLEEGDDGARYELDEGELITMSPNNYTHGRVSVNISSVLHEYAKAKGIGKVCTELGFVLSRNPVTLRGPDVSFIRSERLAGIDLDQFFPGAPDLAVEVVSPSDTVRQMLRKVNQYLRSGTQVVWVVYPDRQEVDIYGATGPVVTLDRDQMLEAPSLLPGFSVAVASLFD